MSKMSKCKYCMDTGMCLECDLDLRAHIDKAKAILLNAVAAPYPCLAIGSKKEMKASINRALEALEGK